ARILPESEDLADGAFHPFDEPPDEIAVRREPARLRESSHRMPVELHGVLEGAVGPVVRVDRHVVTARSRADLRSRWPSHSRSAFRSDSWRRDRVSVAPSRSSSTTRGS